MSATFPIPYKGVVPECQALALRAEWALKLRREAEQTLKDAEKKGQVTRGDQNRLRIEGVIARYNAIIQTAVAESAEKGYFLGFDEKAEASNTLPSGIHHRRQDEFKTFLDNAPSFMCWQQVR